MSQNIHIIVRGHVNVLSHMAGDEQRKCQKILNAGDAFGVIESLQNITLFIDAYTVTVVELCSIPRMILLKLYKAFPEDYQPIKRALEMHMRINRNTLLRLGGRLQAQFALEQSLGQGDFFRFHIYDHKSDYGRIQYMKPFQDLGNFFFFFISPSE